LQSKPQIVLHWMRSLRQFRFRQVLIGIHRHAAHANLVMYVGRSDTARCAGQSYDFSEPHFLPGDDEPLRKMGVIRFKSIAVIDYNQFPVASAMDLRRITPIFLSGLSSPGRKSGSERS